MKKYKPLLIGLLALLLGSCENPSSENESSSNSESFSETISSETELSSSESDPFGLEDPKTNYEIDRKFLTDVILAGNEISTSSTDTNANYLILDAKGRIAYSACYVASGYGTRLKSYLSKGMGDAVTSCFKAGKFIISDYFTGYEITNEGYAKLIVDISNGAISEKDAKNPQSEAIKTWNSSKNTYLSDSLSISFSKEEEMDTRNKELFRLSSIYDNLDSEGKSSYMMESPYKDSYSIKCDSAKSLLVTNEEDKPYELNDGKYSFNKGDKVKITLEGDPYEMFTLEVKATIHEVELPYDVIDNPALSSYQTSGDNSVDPLKACELAVTKRDDGKGLYVNCNNPEALYGDCINTVISGQDVSGKEVFFTFEHNNKHDTSFYYAYRVTNEGESDLFVTVKNIGYQPDGDGCWLGEDEWTQFYNLDFRCNLTGLSKSQLSNFNAYVGFCNKYKAFLRQPMTYRIPKGKYIYVMGGTTLDAYKNINVFDSADIEVSSRTTGCSNGACLFLVSGGRAYGQFMAYTDKDASGINNSKYIKEKAQYGYVTKMEVGGETKDVGSQYAGYDTCHGVVDTNLEWTFNDKTPAGALPVKYVNTFYSSRSRSGKPYDVIENVTPKTYEKAAQWVTHINPATTAEAIGTDMTRYITTDHVTGLPIVIEPARYDGKGAPANIGNWMVDYIDTFTLVNQGDADRTFSYELNHNGIICCFVRDENGLVDTEAYPTKWAMRLAASSYGDAVTDYCNVTITVPAHSVKRFSVDYNLAANSSGYIVHKPKLK